MTGFSHGFPLLMVLGCVLSAAGLVAAPFSMALASVMGVLAAGVAAMATTWAVLLVVVW